MERSHEHGEVWDSFPAEFREMCLVISSNHSDYCIPGAIRYLMDKRKEVEDADSGVSCYHYALWVDHFCITCLYPLEGRRKAWLDNLADLKRLLTTYEELLSDLFLYVRTSGGHRTEETILYPYDLICLSQRLNVYFYTYGQFAQDEKTCRDRLSLILEDSKANVSYLLVHENGAALFKNEWVEDDDFYYPGIEYWQEPLSWLYHDAPAYNGEHGLVSAYSEYAEHLKTCEFLPENKDVRRQLMAIAIMRLTKLHETEFPEEKAPFFPWKWLKDRLTKAKNRVPKRRSDDGAAKETGRSKRRFLLLTAVLLGFYAVFILQTFPMVHPRPWVVIAGAVMIAGAPFLLYYTISSLKDLFAWFGFDDDSDEDDIDDIF